MSNKDEKLSGADELRRIVMNLDATTESFNDRFTLEQLVQIHRAFQASEWDFYPDDWTERQVREALRGIPPRWDDNEKPVYAKRKPVDPETAGTRAFAAAVGMVTK